MIKRIIKDEKYREVNKCIYCKYWLGARPEIQFFNWTCSYTECEGKCEVDQTDSFHMSSGLCHKFKKSLVYL